MNEEVFDVDRAQIGRILHYVIDKRGTPQCRPALVVEDWGGQPRINLQISMDGSNDTWPNTASNWKTSIGPNHKVKEVGTWHWPRECDNLEVVSA